MSTAERVCLSLAAVAWLAGAACMAAVLVDLVARDLVVRVSSFGLVSVALAALLSGAVEAKGKRVLVYLTGGNVSLPAFMAHMEGLDGS